MVTGTQRENTLYGPVLDWDVQVSADAWSPYDVKDIAFNARDVNNVCIDESGTGIMDQRAGAVRAVTRGRVVSIKVPLVHTSRCNARGSG